MSTGTDPQAEYNAVASEITATSSAIMGKMFGMPCLKNNSKAFAGYYHGAMVFKLGAPAHTEEHSSRWLDLAQEALHYLDTSYKASQGE